MKLEKIKESIAKLLASDSLEELAQLGRVLGHELPKKNLKTLAEFRSILARNMPAPERYMRNSLSENGHIRGYVAALEDIAAAYSAEVELQFQEDLNFLREAGYTAVVIALLGFDGQVKSVAQLANEITQQNISAEKVEECLEWLVGSLVDKLEPENQPAFYRLSLRGEKLAQKLASTK